MLKKRILFRVDASKQIGMGHVVRSLALSEILKDHFNIEFVIHSKFSDLLTEQIFKDQVCHIIDSNPQITQIIEGENDIVVLDGYNFDLEYQNLIRSKGCKLVCIDDMHENPFSCDLIINHGPLVSRYDYRNSSCDKFALGPEYLLLRKAFQDEICNERGISIVENLLVVFGGSDYKGISLKLIQSKVSDQFREVHVVLGAASDTNNQTDELVAKQNIYIHHNLNAVDLVQVAKKCQIAICTASGVSYEMACIGIGLIVAEVSENQKYFFDFFQAKGLALGYSFIENDDVDSLADLVVYLKKNPSEILRQMHNQKKVFHQNSAERFLSTFKNL